MSSASDYYIPEIERLSALVRKLTHERKALIDPNDPAVRERLIASFDRSARAIFDYGMAGDGCDPQTLAAMRDDLLAALRSKT